jgi:hypothetical protein
MTDVHLFSPIHSGHLGLQNDRHAVMKLGAEFVWRRSHDREAADPFTFRRVPDVPQPPIAMNRPLLNPMA